MGITRVGNVTGLDCIGIPVAMAVRPKSRSVSVCQGKGLTLDHAFASALMEAVEQFHGEAIAARFRLASFAELSGLAPVIDPAMLSGNGGRLNPVKQINWIEGYDLLGDEPCWLPAEIVHTDFSVESPIDSGVFLRGTNGLASGNHVLEALSAGICEVVERDAVALWSARPIRQRASVWLDPASVDDDSCRWLLDRCGHRLSAVECYQRNRCGSVCLRYKGRVG
jgi:ribosomal protein S12 methylthiotransferase accessory factor